LIEILGETKSLKLFSKQDLEFRDRPKGQIAHIGIILPIKAQSNDNW